MTATSLPSVLDRDSAEFVSNRADMLALLDELDALLNEAAAGGGPDAVRRHADRGKLAVRERLALLLDRDAPFLELSPLAGYYTDYPLGVGLVTGIGLVSGRPCVVCANDPTVLGGAVTPLTVKKFNRALEVARENRLPFIQFVESAGGDLRGVGSEAEQERALRTTMHHFAETGRMFHDLTALSADGVPTLAVVFGSATAGGAYQPGMSDYNIFVRGGAKVFLAGPPLVKVATGEDALDEELGGAELHAEVTGLADYLADSEHEAIQLARGVVAHLPNLRPFGAGPVEEPLHDPDDLLGLVAANLRSHVDVREIIARIVDGSRFEEFKARYGSTVITGWASVYGVRVGIVANNGVLFSDSAQKVSQFIQLCNQIRTPLLFLQHITGYMVGTEYERGGIIKHGSQMINAVSNSTVPHITVILGASYGAGNYGMSGRAFDTRFVFLWPTAKIAVMGPRQMAGVMSIVRRGRAARHGASLDDAAEERRAVSEERFAEAQSRALYATGRVVDDGIIDPRDTRAVVGLSLIVCEQTRPWSPARFGVFRQ